MGYLENIFIRLDQIGLTDVIIPFLLIFTIVFATLTKAKVLGGGPGAKKYSVILALSIALLTIVPHVTGQYPPGKDVVQIINTAVPQVSVVAVAIIMFLILIGIFGAETTWWGGAVSGLVGLGAFIAVIYIFGQALGWWGVNAPAFIRDPATQGLVIIVLVFGLIIWFVTAEPGQRGLLEAIGDTLRRVR